MRSLGPIGLAPLPSFPQPGLGYPSTQPTAKAGKPYNQPVGSAYNRKGQEQWVTNGTAGFRPRSYSPSRPLNFVAGSEERANRSGDTSSASPSDDGGMWPQAEVILPPDYPVFLHGEVYRRHSVDSASSRLRARSAEAPSKYGTRLIFTAKDNEVGAIGDPANRQRRSSHSPRGYTWLNKYADGINEEVDEYHEFLDTEDHDDEGFFSDHANTPPGLHQRITKDQPKVRVRQASSQNPGSTQGIKIKSSGRNAKKDLLDHKNDSHDNTPTGALPHHQSHRENSNSQFELNLSAILRGEETRASLMIKVRL